MSLSLAITFEGHRVRMAGTPERPEWVAKALRIGEKQLITLLLTDGIAFRNAQDRLEPHVAAGRFRLRTVVIGREEDGSDRVTVQMMVRPAGLHWLAKRYPPTDRSGDIQAESNGLEILFDLRSTIAVLGHLPHADLGFSNSERFCHESGGCGCRWLNKTDRLVREERAPGERADLPIHNKGFTVPVMVLHLKSAYRLFGTCAVFTVGLELLASTVENPIAQGDETFLESPDSCSLRATPQ